MAQKFRAGDTVRLDRPYTASEDRYTGRTFVISKVTPSDPRVTVTEGGKKIQLFAAGLTKIVTARRLDRKPVRGRGR